MREFQITPKLRICKFSLIITAHTVCGWFTLVCSLSGSKFLPLHAPESGSLSCPSFSGFLCALLPQIFCDWALLFGPRKFFFTILQSFSFVLIFWKLDLDLFCWWLCIILISGLWIWLLYLCYYLCVILFVLLQDDSSNIKMHIITFCILDLIRSVIFEMKKHIIIAKF